MLVPREGHLWIVAKKAESASERPRAILDTLVSAP
jgi:hypothetical protein